MAIGYLAQPWGGIFGALIQFDTEGLEFVMTAMFVVIFLEQWSKENCHISSLLGLGLSCLCLLIFGPDQFMIPAMGTIFLALTAVRRGLEKEERAETEGGRDRKEETGS